MSNPLVAVLMGSESDRELMNQTGEMLSFFGIEHEVVVSSAHRSPEKTRNYVKEAGRRGVRVFIAGAGMSAHLPGAIAAETVLPVIGVPLPGSALSGADSLHSIVQMPTGVPVATMAIGKAGAKNAAILAAQILALGDDGIRERLLQYKRDLAAG